MAVHCPFACAEQRVIVEKVGGVHPGEDGEDGELWQPFGRRSKHVWLHWADLVAYVFSTKEDGAGGAPNGASLLVVTTSYPGVARVLIWRALQLTASD
jgi:hypothetical protein